MELAFNKAENNMLIIRIDNYYFYKHDTWLDGYELNIFKKNKNLPVMKEFRLKRTFNIGDSVNIKKEKELICIDKFFINKKYHYYLDIENREILSVKIETSY
jgi:hypothetical protein